MENKPLISIIVPIYNAERLIDRCMQSIYRQTFDNYEIILVNDGSTDNSGEICKAFQSKDERVKYIEKQNNGAGSARNAGLAIAQGEYVAFPDVDDWFAEEMYAELYELAKNNEFDMVISGVNYYRQNDNQQLEYSRTENVKALSFVSKTECRKNIMEFFPTTTIFDVPWNKLYKRSIIIENDLKFPDLRRCQDATFNIDFYNCINSVVSIDKAYYNYMENTVSDIQRKFPPNLIDINIFYYNHLIQILTNWHMYVDEIKTHYDSSFVITIYSTMGRFDNPRWNLSRSEQKKYICDILERNEIRNFLSNANVSKDVQYMYNLLLKKDINRFLFLHEKEKLKDCLRNKRRLISAYRKLRGKR